MELNEDIVKIILAIIGVIAGGFTIRFFIKRNSDNNSSKNVIIRDNKVKGDLAGRDIVKKNKK